MAEGRAEGLRQAIELLLDMRFGEEGRNLIPDVLGITGEAALKSLLQEVTTADTVQDVRALLRPADPRGGA